MVSFLAQTSKYTSKLYSFCLHLHTEYDESAGLMFFSIFYQELKVFLLCFAFFVVTVSGASFSKYEEDEPKKVKNDCQLCLT